MFVGSVTKRRKVGTNLVISEFSSLWKAIHTFNNFNVDFVVMDELV